MTGVQTCALPISQRVGLVHELRKLARTEELFQRGRNRLRVDQVVRHQGFGFGLAEAFLDSLLDPRQARAVLVLGQLADAANAPVPEVIDVVDLAATVAQLAHLPKEVTAKLSAVLLRVVTFPEVKQKLNAAGFDLDPSDAVGLAKLIDSEVKRWGQLTKTAKIEAE